MKEALEAAEKMKEREKAWLQEYGFDTWQTVLASILKLSRDTQETLQEVSEVQDHHLSQMAPQWFLNMPLIQDK